ncbi:MAG: hypothetical protein E6R03_09605 [Hyphomicrobiaceae bacterium]|nr:MAG: hypothetical protein E6R03_09605 [Hyphomicrobiaceae bacterium]
MINSEQVSLFSACRKQASEFRPYQAGITRLMVPTWTDGDKVQVNRRAILKLGADRLVPNGTLNLAWLLVRMSDHVFRRHHMRIDRCVGDKPTKASLHRANLAANLECNQHILRVYTPQGEDIKDWDRPKDFGLPDGQAMEWYYINLPDVGEGDTNDDLDTTDGGGGGSPPDEPSSEEGEDEDSGEEGPDSDGENDKGQGKPSPLPGRSKAEIDAAIRQAAYEILTGGQKAGSVPDDLQRIARDMFAPAVVPWTDILAHVLFTAQNRASGHQEYDYSRFSRYQGIYGFTIGVPWLPTFWGYEPTIDLVVDTSASVDAKLLGVIVNQIRPLFEGMTIKVRVWAGDTKLAAQGVAQSLDEAMGLFKGGGGTDFRPLFHQLSKLERHERCSLAILLTDGEGPMPAENPLPDADIYYVQVGPHQRRPYSAGGSSMAAVPYGTSISVPYP